MPVTTSLQKHASTLPPPNENYGETSKHTDYPSPAGGSGGDWVGTAEVWARQETLR